MGLLWTAAPGLLKARGHLPPRPPFSVAHPRNKEMVLRAHFPKCGPSGGTREPKAINYIYIYLYICTYIFLGMFHSWQGANLPEWGPRWDDGILSLVTLRPKLQDVAQEQAKGTP